MSRPSAPAFKYQLSTLLLLVTLAAVCLGVATWSPSIGIALTLLATIACVRTIVAGRRSHPAGPFTIEEKVMTFLASLGITGLLCCASIIALYTTCWVSIIAGLVGTGGGELIHYLSWTDLGWYLAMLFRDGGTRAVGFDICFIASVLIGLVPAFTILYVGARRFWPYREFERRNRLEQLDKGQNDTLE